MTIEYEQELILSWYEVRLIIQSDINKISFCYFLHIECILGFSISS